MKNQSIIASSRLWLLSQMICLSVCCDFALSADVYKWVDKDGRTHYGEKPPGEIDSAKRLELPDSSSPTDSAEAAEQRLRRIRKRLSVYQEERLEKRERLEKEREERKKRASECRRLKAELSDYKRGGIAWYELDDDGKRTYISDAEMATRVKNMESVINKKCR